ncbi:response regulator [Paenibacillus sp. EKM202P]|uniref:response regulator n=1 Tax=unclassified Paenibacillus TaxID=185978 RepID=UPI0013EA0C99|nr:MULTISPECIES: response regulator [unclassified Paenibacillus]KAF6563625.1 response regulator [Paenibacillus sp. EKM202P]KAF6568646.1 response regulator [Paenibacillus sp. EKM207P]
MSFSSKTIVIVDDEQRTRQGIHQTLEQWASGKYRIMTSGNGLEALHMLQAERVHLLITDVRLPEFSGLDLIRSLERESYRPAIIVISGYAEFDYVQQALRLGAVNYLLKPIDKQELLNAVNEALQLEEERQRYKKLDKLADPVLLELDLQATTLSDPVRRAFTFMAEHLHEPITMAQTAAHSHLNASYFSVLFKEQSGLSFSEYLHRIRIQRAKELLLHTQLTIAQIGERSGYRTDKYFIKVFKATEGVSPSRYRQQMRKGPENID